MIFDTHAHYDDEAFSIDRDILLQQMNISGISNIVNIGASMNSSHNTMELIEKYPFIYGTVGVHPSETKELTWADILWLKEASKHPKILAIGEIGLDYYWPEPDRDIQKKWFIEQLRLAKEVKIPVVIHSRDAANDTLTIMKDEKASEIGGVIHCYSYAVEHAKEYLEMGFYFGIGGVLTFKNGKKLREVVEYLPMDRIVLETDSPYLAPEPFRGKRNSSLHLPYVIEKISQIKGLSQEEVISITSENANKLYRLG